MTGFLFPDAANFMPKGEEQRRQAYSETKEYARRNTQLYRMRHPDRVKAQQQKRYWENRERELKRTKDYQDAHREQHRRVNNKRTVGLKTEVLTHYGPFGILKCSWPGCPIDDLDMLSLDHINNDGHEHRKKTKGKGGGDIYRLLVKEGFPKGFQTLCWNHQIKKELVRKRALMERPVITR